MTWAECWAVAGWLLEQGRHSIGVDLCVRLVDRAERGEDGPGWECVALCWAQHPDNWWTATKHRGRWRGSGGWSVDGEWLLGPAPDFGSPMWLEGPSRRMHW